MPGTSESSLLSQMSEHGGVVVEVVLLVLVELDVVEVEVFEVLVVLLELVEELEEVDVLEVELLLEVEDEVVVAAAAFPAATETLSIISAVRA